MSKRYSAEEFTAVTRQLTDMFAAGRSLSDVLTTIARQQENKYLRKVLMQVCDSVMKGYPLSTAMARHTDELDKEFIKIVRKGELNGNLIRRCVCPHHIGYENIQVHAAALCLTSCTSTSGWMFMQRQPSALPAAPQ